jgi:hypothetical protein
MSKTSRSAQTKFSETYVTTTEICRRLSVTRSTLHMARITGKLPDAIDVQGQLFLWERNEIEPYLSAWEIILNARRGIPA